MLTHSQAEAVQLGKGIHCTGGLLTHCSHLQTELGMCLYPEMVLSLQEAF